MRIVLTLAVAIALVAFFALDGPRYVSLETVKANREALVAYSHAHRAEALSIAFVVFAAANALALPVGLALSITCGFLFGRWTGMLVVVAAATTGGVLLFLGARYVAAGAVRKRLGALGTRIDAGFTRHGFAYMLSLRLMPLPLSVATLAPAMTSLPLRTFALGTLIGVVPSAFVLANLGEALGRVETLHDIVSWETLAALALLSVLVLASVGLQAVASRRNAAR